MTTILSGAGLLPLRTNMQPVAAMEPAASPEYGKYMVDFLSCGDCHGADLTGGAPGGLFPAGPNIAASVSGWTQEQFAHAIRTGERPFGLPLNVEMMPYLTYRNMDDTELAAVYHFIVSLPE